MLRERAGITCAELAEKIGVREPDMERIERGAVDADWATLRILANELKLPLDALIELAEECAPGGAASNGEVGREKQNASGTLADAASKGSNGDHPFPGWEPFLPHLVHPLKVAIVEALLWIGEPLSAVQLGKVFRGVGDGFRESNVRYHVRHLAEVGVIEATPVDTASGGRPSRERFFYFADRRD